MFTSVLFVFVGAELTHPHVWKEEEELLTDQERRSSLDQEDQKPEGGFQTGLCSNVKH